MTNERGTPRRVERHEVPHTGPAPRPAQPPAVVAEADDCVEIPMVGRGASLNVAVAGSLVLYRLAGLS